MITEAIYQDKKWSKGSPRVDIRKFIEKNYDVDEKALKTDLASNLAKMLEQGSNEYSCLTKHGDDNYKLTKEWRKEWKTRNGIKSVKRKKAKKDKDAPKGPRNAYIYYMQDVRKTITEQYPDKDSKAITKLLGQEWKALPPKKKKKYEEQAEEDKIRHTRDVKAYNKKKQEESSESESSSSSRSKSPPKKRKHKSKREDSESDSRGKKKKKESSEEESEKKNEESEGDKKKKKSEGNQSKPKEK